MEPRIATRDEWLAARKLLLTKEKEHTRVSDELNRQRRELPWVRVEKEYVFDAPTGKITPPSYSTVVVSFSSRTS
jgi:predicted dithiol-disulfide oxidoreductase (DUF899 family)